MAKENLNESETIKKQVEFIEWLRDRDMYSIHETPETMNKMFKVWAEFQDPKLVAIDRSKLMSWYDLLQEALEKPQYDHLVRGKAAVKEMMNVLKGG